MWGKTEKTPLWRTALFQIEEPRHEENNASLDCDHVSDLACYGFFPTEGTRGDDTPYQLLFSGWSVPQDEQAQLRPEEGHRCPGLQRVSRSMGTRQEG